MDEFELFLSSSDLPSENTILVGDLNFHVDNPNDKNALKFTRLYVPLGFEQLVQEPTHIAGHTLDLVLTRCKRLVPSIEIENVCLSDHFLVTLGTDMSRPRVPRKVIKCRNLSDIDMNQFRNDLLKSSLIRGPPDDPNALVSLYNSVLSGLLDLHAPETVKTVPDRPNSEWFNDDMLIEKRSRRRAERKKRKSGLAVDIQAYNKAKMRFKKASDLAKNHSLSDRVLRHFFVHTDSLKAA